MKILQWPLLNLLQLPQQFSFLQRTVGSILSTLVTDCNGLNIWPNLLLDLLKISCQRPAAALSSIEKICEDAAFELIDYPETFKPFLESILTLLQQNSKDEALKSILVSIICHLIPTQALLLTENVTFLLNCLLAPSESVKLQISTCRLLSTLIEFYWTFLASENLKNIFNYVYVCTSQSEDRDLLKQCAEFWLFQVQSDSAVDQFQAAPEMLIKLIPLLVSRCAYDDEEDEEELCAAMEDLSVPDEEDLQPRHRKDKKSVKEDDFEEDEGIDSSEIVDSLRKCSAATLDGLSLAVDPKLFLKIFLPAFNSLVSSTDWKQREGALLAFGAVAEGLCQHLAVAGHLNQIVPFILANARTHPHPLVRSMSLWALSRVSTWLTDCESEIESSTEESLTILIATLGDANKRVQQSAATALCKFLESSNAATFFTQNHQKSLVSAIFLALKCYQRRSLLILFDLIRIFGQIDENLLEFDQESLIYWRQIASELVDRLNPQSIADSSIFAVIEALMSILLLDFNGKLLTFEKRSEMEFKALSLAAQNLTALNETIVEGFADSIVSQGLDDFLIASLDLLAAATESSKLTPSPQLQPLLKNILTASLSFKESTNVRQSAFALFGDYAINNHKFMIEMEATYFDALELNLYPSSLSNVRNPSVLVSMSTATNAVWSLGEYSLHAVVDIEIFGHLVSILKDSQILEAGARIYYENVAVCIGRVLIKTSINVDISGAFLNRILNLLTTVESALERSTALIGYLKTSKSNSSLNQRDYQLLISKLNDLVDFQNNLLPDLSQILIGFNHPQVDSLFYSQLQPLLRNLLFF